MQHTRQLKQEVGTALSLKECKNIIENTFNDGFEFNTKQVNEANTSKEECTLHNVSKCPIITEFCIRYMAGNIEVKYTREYNSKEALRLMDMVNKGKLGEGFFYRHIC